MHNCVTNWEAQVRNNVGKIQVNNMLTGIGKHTYFLECTTHLKNESNGGKVQHVVDA